MQLLTEAAGLALPANTLDTILDLLGGPSAVAELTGRKERLVQRSTGGFQVGGI